MDPGEVWTNRFDGALRHSTTKRGTCGSPLGCVAYGDMKKFNNKPNKFIGQIAETFENHFESKEITHQIIKLTINLT